MNQVRHLMRSEHTPVKVSTLRWVLLAMKKKLSFNPINIRLPGADAVMFHPQLTAHLVEQFGRCGHG